VTRADGGLKRTDVATALAAHRAFLTARHGQTAKSSRPPSTPHGARGPARAALGGGHRHGA
jgi:hypothetical protein